MPFVPAGCARIWASPKAREGQGQEILGGMIGIPTQSPTAASEARRKGGLYGVYTKC